MATICQRCHKEIGFLEGLMLQGSKDLCASCKQIVLEETRRQQLYARQQQLSARQKYRLLNVNCSPKVICLNSKRVELFPNTLSIRCFKCIIAAVPNVVLLVRVLSYKSIIGFLLVEEAQVISIICNFYAVCV